MTEQEPAEEQPEDADDGSPEGEEQPDIEASERADLDGLADLADQVEEEAGAEVKDDEDDADDDETTDESAAMPKPGEASGGADWGDLYCSTVTTGLNAVIEEYGDEDAEPVDESLARDLHLDEYVNDWLAEQGKAEMDPAQGMVVATGALCLTVLVSKTDIPQMAMQKLQNDDGQ